MRSLKVIAPIIICFIMLIVDYLELGMGSEGSNLIILLFIKINYVILLCLFLNLFFEKKFFKGIALGGFVAQLIFASYSIFSVFSAKRLNYDLDIIYLTIFLQFLRIVAIYCIVSNKHELRSEGATNSTQ
jgi:hypothetical protein